MRGGSRHPAERALEECRLSIAVLVEHWPLARQALEDAQPGYPSRASGANLGGSGGRTITVDGDRVPVTSVEAVALTNDKARSDQRRLEEAVVIAAKALWLAHRITVDWSRGRREGQPAEGRTQDDVWCVHHYKAAQILEPRGDRYADDLCRWCHDFRAEVGQLPHPTLVRLHHEGRRMTDRLVARYHPHYRAVALA